MLKGQLFYSGSIPGSVTRCLKVLLNTFVQLHTYKMTKVDTEFSKVGSKFCQILIKPSKSCQYFSKFRQIWSHWSPITFNNCQLWSHCPFLFTSTPVRSRLFLPDTTASWTRIGLMATAAAAPRRARAARGAISAANGLMPPSAPPPPPPPPLYPENKLLAIVSLPRSS